MNHKSLRAARLFTEGLVREGYTPREILAISNEEVIALDANAVSEVLDELRNKRDTRYFLG